jgi:hypothetical protein
MSSRTGTGERDRLGHEAAVNATIVPVLAMDDEQQPRLAVLLLDEPESGAGADRVPADASLSSISTARQGLTAPLLLPPGGSVAGRSAGSVGKP